MEVEFVESCLNSPNSHVKASWMVVGGKVDESLGHFEQQHIS